MKQGANMNYIGIDLHRKFSQIDVYDDASDAEITQRLANDQVQMRTGRFLKLLLQYLT